MVDPRLRVEPGSLSTPCWIWTRARDRKGYGWLRRGSHMIRAHRAFYETQVGPIPDGLHVLHRCDNPPCCRPDHLWLGTNADNTADKITKGRARYRQLHGEASPRSKLTSEQVDDIRAALSKGLESQYEIARRFGVRQPTISDIRTGRSWSYFNPEQEPNPCP